MNTIPKGCKPFNLQECMAGKPVVTRDGRPSYKFGAYNPAAYGNHKIVGWVNNIRIDHTENGSYSTDGESTLDLFMKAETKTLHHAIAKTDDGRYFSTSAHEEKETVESICQSMNWEIIKIYETEVEI